MRQIIFSVLFVSAVFFGCQASVDTGDNITPQKISETALQALLDSLNLTGTILLFDEVENTYYANDFKAVNNGQLPASTFKIPNTIIALETGVASSSDHLFVWDGTDRWLNAWEQDLTLKEAFAASCVPCYQEVARAVGPERMRAELKRLGYPDMVFDSATVANFWLGGNSRISPQEQIDFLRQIYHKKLPLKPATQVAIRDIMVRERTDDYILSGKTGWSVDGAHNNGWFVGFVEWNEEVLYFATNVEPGPGFDMDGFPEARVTVTRLALTQLGIL